CEQALMAAYEQRVRVVTIEVIEQIAARFRLEPSPDLNAEESSSPSTEPAPARPQYSGTPPNAPAAKADSDAIIMYLDDESAIPSQPVSPSKSTEPLGRTPSDDFVPYTRKIKQQTIDRDKIREFLSEFDSQSRKTDPGTVSFDLSDLSDALASANTAS